MNPEKIFSPMLLDGSQASSIYHALVDTGHMELASLILSKSKLAGRGNKYAAAARIALQGAGEFEIDEIPVVSHSNDGAFVMVWYWVVASAASK